MRNIDRQAWDDRGAYFKFKGNVTKSFLCVQCKSKGATRAARAQCAHPVLSAKRRHQIHDVDHRDGGAEHLWQQRQFPHAVSIMIGNGRTAPTCQSGLAGRMGEWCTRRAHSMDCSHGTGPWHVPVVYRHRTRIGPAGGGCMLWQV